MKIVYNSNNSGGEWWVEDSGWEALEKAGWVVNWAKDWEPSRLSCMFVDSDGRYMGALARDAYRIGLSMEEAIREWEAATGCDSSDLGCACCGAPHSFSMYDDDGERLDDYSPFYPTRGNRYGE